VHAKFQGGLGYQGGIWAGRVHAFHLEEKGEKKGEYNSSLKWQWLKDAVKAAQVQGNVKKKSISPKRPDCEKSKKLKQAKELRNGVTRL